MAIKLKYFNLPEAEALIPEVSKCLKSAQNTKEKIEAKVESWRKVQSRIGPADEAVMRGQVDFLASELERQLGKITEMGCLPKDLDLGLVDFPARIEGREAYLCWKLGEDKISFWHGLTDGFSGRKALMKES